jgi:hypothetical protein
LDLRPSGTKSKKLGQVSLGRQATATDKITEINLRKRAVGEVFDVEDTGPACCQPAVNGNLTNSDPSAPLIGDGGDQPRRRRRFRWRVRRFLPRPPPGAWTIWTLPLTMPASTRRRFAAGISYGVITDNNQTQTVCAGANAPALNDGLPPGRRLIHVIHEKTGLFVNLARTEDRRFIDATTRFTAPASTTASVLATQAGIERKFVD